MSLIKEVEDFLREEGEATNKALLDGKEYLYKTHASLIKELEDDGFGINLTKTSLNIWYESFKLTLPVTYHWVDSFGVKYLICLIKPVGYTNNREYPYTNAIDTRKLRKLILEELIKWKRESN